MLALCMILIHSTEKLIPKTWSIYSALFLWLYLLFPYVKSFQILLAFLLTQHCFLLLTQFAFYKPLSFPYQSHILGQWFFKLFLQNVSSLKANFILFYFSSGCWCFLSPACFPFSFLLVRGSLSFGDLFLTPCDPGGLSLMIIFSIQWDGHMIQAGSTIIPCSLKATITHLVKNPPAMQETLVRFLGWKDLLEKG